MKPLALILAVPLLAPLKAFTVGPPETNRAEHPERSGVQVESSSVSTTASIRWAEGNMVQLAGEAARRRGIQKQYLWRYQAGSLRDNEGFVDFERELLAPYLVRLSAKEVKERILCAYTAVGKTLEASVVYADTDHDAALAAVNNRYFKALVGSQDENGYFGILKYDQEPPLFSGWILHDAAYINLAALEHHRRFGAPESLRLARRFTDLAIRSWPRAPQAPGACSPIGLSEAACQLYLATQDPAYLRFFADTAFDGRFIDKESVREWRQALHPPRAKAAAAAGAKAGAKVHPYRFFARCLDQLRLNELQPSPELEVMSDYALAKMLSLEAPGMFITGATGRREGWVEDQNGCGRIGEACAVTHQVWWLAKLLEQRHDLSYGDLMERMILNHLYAAQNADPADGRSRYFTAVSGPRSFNKNAHCCEGNTRRFWAHLPELVYLTSRDTFAVNLFIPSTLKATISNTLIELVQKTDYPREGEIHFTLTPQQPVEFTLQLRLPRWATAHTVAVNGAPARPAITKGAISLRRTWRPGDSVTLSLPMSYRWIAGHGFYQGRAALMRGPQVFCVSRTHNPALNSISLDQITLKPDSVRTVTPPAITAARHGQAAEVKAWSPGRPRTAAPDLCLILTDFPEVTGEETYFPLTDLSAALPDELYQPANLARFQDRIGGGH
jgi:DUF1680 family protein